MFTKHRHWYCTLAVALCCGIISAPLSAQSDIANATNKAALNKLSVELKKRAETAQKHAKDVAKRSGLPVRRELPSGRTIEIQRISPTGRPVYYITNNVNAADTVSTDELWPGGSTGLNLNGSGMTVGEWDAGAVYPDHTDFIDRLTQVDNPAEVSDHSTHVAGTLIGSGLGYAPATGMAYAADLDAYDWNFDTAEMALAAAGGLPVSNHSYGIAAGWISIGGTAPDGWWWIGGTSNSDVEDSNFGYYDSQSQLWDEIAFNAPYYLIVKAAGNDRNDIGPPLGEWYKVINQDGSFDSLSKKPRNADCAPAGYDCLPTFSVAKNILTVGAVNDVPSGYTPLAGPSQVAMMSFSGWGPTDDGRIKPDLVGNGEFVVSTIPAPYFYGAADGTSMAAPNVTGSLLLLQQHYENIHGAGNFMRSATLKALAIHTADEAGDADGPDYEFGWGLLNTQSAAQVITEDGGGYRIIEDTLSDSSTNTIQINVNEPEAFIKVTLAWTDPPGTPVTASLDPTDLMLVNDLDLRVKGVSSTHMPWVLNPASPANPATTGDNFRDNVEQVVINNGGPGAYSVEVSHKGTLLNGQNQSYSLVISVTTQPSTAGSSLLIDEDFTGGLPPGWSVETVSGVDWTIKSPVPGDTRLDNLTGGTGNFAMVDNNFIYTTDSSLRMPTLDLSTATAVVLRFKSYFIFELYESINVDVSTNGGTSWGNVWMWQGFNPSPTLYTLDLTGAAAGQPNFSIRFRYDSESDYVGDLWQVDDVELEVFGGTVAGNPCANAYNLPANQWRLISLPCDPGTSNSILDVFGDDLLPADYDVRWVLFARDELADQYQRITDPTSTLQQGEGYFFYSLDSGLLDVAGTATPLTYRTDCPSPDNNCFVIPLIKPVNDTSTLFNALGHPLPYPVDWADFRIAAADGSGSPMTPSEALTNNYLSKVAHKYTGSAYVPYDDVTPGYDEGALGAYDGFWVETLGDSFNAGDLVLLVPNMRSPGVITTDTVAASTLESTTMATSSSVKTKIPPGLAKRDAHRQSHRDAIKKSEEWYVRLTVEAAAEQLKDDGNILGQLYDSEFGFDQHDLVETPPNTPYLTIIFPQETWGENADDYTSDYHPVTPIKVLDQWSFEVRSDDPAREVTLEWTGPARILGMSWLIDQETGEIIEPDSRGSYTFTMNGQKRYFTWEYEKRPGNSPRKY